MTTAPLPADLADAIERAYAVFAGYRFANTVGCACCNDDEVRALSHRRLTETPLRELSVEDVDYVCMEILGMWGDPADAKVLAPRVLELVAASLLLDETLGTPSPLPTSMVADEGWVLRLFDLGHWLDWPAWERLAVEACFRSLWSDLLANAKNAPIDQWTDQEPLLAILSLVPAVEPYLEGFLAGPRQARHLVWFLRAYLEDRAEGVLGVRDLEDGIEERFAEIDAWLHGEPVRDALVRAIDDPASEPFRWELVLGLVQLRRPEVIPFERGRPPTWVPDAEALELARELGVDLDRDR